MSGPTISGAGMPFCRFSSSNRPRLAASALSPFGISSRTLRYSVLILTADGWWKADLTRRASKAEACTMNLGAESEMWTVDPPVPGALVARVFERGSYSVSGGALRYRRGLGGRQPLTLNVFDERSTMEARVDRVVFRLVPDGLDAGGDAGSAALQFWMPETR